MTNFVRGLLAGLFALSMGSAQATLIDRGGGLLYDNVLNITWLQDANYAKTSGYDTDGLMTWSDAMTWADQLVYGGYSGWRLPSTIPAGDDWNYLPEVNGSADAGFNITSRHSELSYMYYVNLGLKGLFSPAGDVQPDFGVFGNGTHGVQTNVGLVRNLLDLDYWYGAAFAPRQGRAWAFSTDIGYQWGADQNYSFGAWAVRSGDVAATQDGNDVPEPAPLALLAIALAGLGATRRTSQLGGRQL